MSDQKADTVRHAVYEALMGSMKHGVSFEDVYVGSLAGVAEFIATVHALTGNDALLEAAKDEGAESLKDFIDQAAKGLADA